MSKVQKLGSLVVESAGRDQPATVRAVAQSVEVGAGRLDAWMQQIAPMISASLLDDASHVVMGLQALADDLYDAAAEVVRDAEQRSEASSAGVAISDRRSERITSDEAGATSFLLQLANLRTTEAQAVSAALRRVSDERDDLRAELVQERAAVDQLASDVRTLNDDNVRLVHEVSGMASRINAMDTQITALIQALEETAERRDSVSAALRTLQREHTKVCAERDAFRDALHRKAVQS